ncbi:MAG: hypothetical protein JO147_11325 [Actinobacteria bacterium]|nr:hypothetical protein [Actinomycetota bacterium]
MRIASSLFLIALGAILRFAVTRSVNGLNLHVVGVVLMIVGLVGLIVTVALAGSRRRTDVRYRRDGVTYVEPGPGVDPYA